MTTTLEIGPPSSPTMSRPFPGRSVLALLGVLAGLCAIFALVVSVADGVREYAQKSWPQATATVEGCSVDPYVPIRSASRTPVWYVRCRIGYRTDSDEIETSIRSRSTTSGWGGDAEGMRRWVAHHRSGSQLVVHYDPSEHKTAVLTATDMPYAGPRTPDNLRLLLISSVAYFGLLVISRRCRAQSKLPNAR
jgi:hypothetical protein